MEESDIESLTDAEEAFCDVVAQAECRRVMISQGIIMGTAFLLAGVGEAFFLDDPVHREHLLLTLPLQIILSYFTALAFARWELTTRHAIAFALGMAVLVGSLGGLVLGGLGGFDGPFFYSIYMVPSFIMLVPCNLALRILGTFAILVGFAGLFLMQQASIAIPSPDVTSSSVFIIAAASILLGHRNWNILRERAVAMHRLESDRESTRARNEELASRLRAQARRARSLVHEVNEVQKSERLKIARDVHDDVGQLLVGAKMELELLEHKGESGEPLGFEQLDRLYEVVYGLEGGIRQMLGRLREDSPHDLALLLDELLDGHRDRVDLITTIPAPLLARLGGELGSMAYRVIQEGLTNSCKHSDGGCVWVIIEECEEGTLRIAVEDDGSAGIMGGDGERWGVLGLRERATLLGGEVNLRREGARTILEALFPAGTLQVAAQGVSA